MSFFCVFLEIENILNKTHIWQKLTKYRVNCSNKDIKFLESSNGI